MELLVVFLLAGLGSVIPTIVYVTIAWWLDRYEKEPLWLMSLAFVWGCIPAIILSMVAEVGLMVPLAALNPDADMTAMTAVLIAPGVEEIFKCIPLIVMFLVYRKEFDGLIDGLLYGALVGFGFAMTENFMYVLGAYQQGGLASMFVTLFLRTVVFGMMHALWTSMFGLGLGMARYATTLPGVIIPPIVGLMVGILLHGIHNFGATQGGWFMLLTFGSYVVGCAAWLVLMLLAGRGESRWIREELEEEVNLGLISGDQALASFRYRSRVANRWQALHRHGAGHALTLGDLYSKCAKLAMKKRQLKIHPHVSDTARDVAKLRDEIARLQAKLTTQPPVSPQLPPKRF